MVYRSVWIFVEIVLWCHPAHSLIGSWCLPSFTAFLGVLPSCYRVSQIVTVFFFSRWQSGDYGQAVPSSPLSEKRGESLTFWFDYLFFFLWNWNFWATLSTVLGIFILFFCIPSSICSANNLDGSLSFYSVNRNVSSFVFLSLRPFFYLCQSS